MEGVMVSQWASLPATLRRFEGVTVRLKPGALKKSSGG